MPFATLGTRKGAAICRWSPETEWRMVAPGGVWSHLVSEPGGWLDRISGQTRAVYGKA